MDQLLALFGRNVRAFREHRGMTQEALAFDANLKRSYLSELERGLRNPSIRVLGRLATALGIDPAELLRSD